MSEITKIITEKGIYVLREGVITKAVKPPLRKRLVGEKRPNIRETIRTALAQRHEGSVGWLVRATGCPKATLHQFLNGRRKSLPIEHIEEIFYVLGLRIKQPRDENYVAE